jgi:putative ABC transport system permease protein
VLRLALRDFRGGLRGLSVLLLSIALGVFAITAIGSLSLTLKDALARQGQAILDGDVSFDLAQREASPAELDFLKSQGRLTTVAFMRAMAQRPGGEAALAEIKAVDDAYPLSDGPVLDPPMPLADALGEDHGVYGLVAEPALLARLGLATGGVLMIGEARFEVRSRLTFEPDRLASGLRFGPAVLISQRALRASGLLQPGSLVKWRYRVLLNGQPASDEALAAVSRAAQKQFPAAGWEERTRNSISPQFSKNLDRFTGFLTLVGLTALIVGGVGVANAVRAFADRKRETIATLKSLGATGTTVFTLMLTQAMLVAGAGAALGAACGAILPFPAAPALAPVLPFPVSPAIYPAAIGEGLLYGFLTALTFSVAPLGRTHDVPAQALFRSGIEPQGTWPRPRYVVLSLAAALCLAAAAAGLSADRKIAVIYACAALAALLFLRGASLFIAYGAKRLPHARDVALRLAIASLHRPGGLTSPVMLSLGLGLALLAALVEIDGNITGALNQSIAGETPSFFFLDVPRANAQAFADFLQAQAPDGKIALVPMLRGRIVRLKGLDSSAVRPKDSVAWVLHGDRGITFSESVPEGSSIAEGSWWPKDYAGPPLVSIETEAAEGLGVAIGDEITVNVLGREVTARIASTRRVNWRSYGINFVLVFSPNSFAGAPYNDLATLAFAAGSDPAREAVLMRETAKAFPAITTIRVKDALDAAAAIAGELAFAIRCASSVALLASILVLGGAIDAGQDARTHEAVVLKTLGAAKARLLAAYAYEYGLTGLFAGLVGLAAGSAAAFVVVRLVMDLEFVWLWQEGLIAIAGAVAATILIGLVGTWRVLGCEPATYLREL